MILCAYFLVLGSLSVAACCAASIVYSEQAATAKPPATPAEALPHARVQGAKRKHVRERGEPKDEVTLFVAAPLSPRSPPPTDWVVDIPGERWEFT